MYGFPFAEDAHDPKTSNCWHTKEEVHDRRAMPNFFTVPGPDLNILGVVESYQRVSAEGTESIGLSIASTYTVYLVRSHLDVANNVD